MERSRFKAAFSSELPIKIVNGIHHFLDGEIVFDELLAAFAKSVAKRGIVCQLKQAIIQSGQIAGLDKKSGFAVAADFARAVAIIVDNRFCSSKGLRQCARQPFPK